MKKVMISPSKYVQGENELCNLGEYVKAFGNKALRRKVQMIQRTHLRNH